MALAASRTGGGLGLDGITDGVHSQGMAKSLACYVGWHKWQNRVNDEGQRYVTCARCGKEDEAGWVAPPLV